MPGVRQNYAIPHLAAEARLARCNLPPRTIMRGPGTMQAVLLIEHVMDRVAAHLGLDPVLVRERNLLQHPKSDGGSHLLNNFEKCNVRIFPVHVLLVQGPFPPGACACA